MQIFKFLLVAVAALIQKVYTSDIDILQYALILENLESAFYANGVKMFAAEHFNDAGFAGQYDQFKLLAQQEADHVTFLTAALQSVNATPYPACTYNFNFKTVGDFVGAARALEAVGVSAYIGAVNQISNPAYTTAAATITTIEARHQSYLEVINNSTGFPNSFDTPLSATQVVTLASAFIKSCPFDLPKTNRALNTTASGAAGSRIYVNNVMSTNGLYCSFVFGSNQTWSKVYRANRRSYCTAPQDIKGIVYVFITNDNTTPVTGNATSVVYGPAIFTVANAKAANSNSVGSSNNNNNNNNFPFNNLLNQYPLQSSN